VTVTDNNKNAIRVALILSELSPGGMERVVVHLANGLVARGIETMVVCLQNAGEFAPLLDRRVRFEALASVTAMDVMAVWRMRNVLRSFGPTVINIHDYTSTPYLVAGNWIGQRKPIVFTAHGELYEGFDHLRGRMRFFSKGFSHLTGVSAAIVECHKKFLGWSGSSSVIRNGVPAVQLDKAAGCAVRDELGLADGEFFFLSIGNPRTEKAFEDLIDAVALLREQLGSEFPFKVAIAGALSDSDYCRDLARRLDERGVGYWCTFIGFRQDTAALYAAADAFVLSSRSEGLPMVILEAMMAGLPVVATKVGGIPDAVGERALLVDAARPEQLAVAMARLMREPSLVETLGSTGKAHVEETFGVERMVDDYVALYAKIVGSAI